MSIKKLIIIIPMAILGVLAIIFLAMLIDELEEDSKVWESPYDESLITENVVLDVADDVSSILQAVGGFLSEKVTIYQESGLIQTKKTGRIPNYFVGQSGKFW